MLLPLYWTKYRTRKSAWEVACFPGMAKTLVSKSSSNAQTGTNPPQNQEWPSAVTESSQGNSSTLGQTKRPSLSLIGEGLDKYNLLLSAKDVLMASWRPNLPKEMVTVGTALKRTLMSLKLLWIMVLNFFVSLYKSGLGYSAINTARSALSSTLVLQDGEKCGEHPLVVCCMIGTK